MKEAELQQRVIARAVLEGWKCWHIPAPMRWTKTGFVGAKEGAGIPDLILLHDNPPRLIFAELKGTGGKPSDAQLEFLRAAKVVADDIETPMFSRPMGVYLVTPETEEAFGQVLRSKVLT